jgi:acyl-CoA synthetase (AMP-forming)/AMP-acid ligase II
MPCPNNQIASDCKQLLARYKAHRSIESRQELPKSQSGKMLRRILVTEEQQTLAT